MLPFFSVDWGPPPPKDIDMRRHRWTPSSKRMQLSPNTALRSTFVRSRRGGDDNFRCNFGCALARLGKWFCHSSGYQPWKITKCLNFPVSGPNYVRKVLLTLVGLGPSLGALLTPNHISHLPATLYLLGSLFQNSFPCVTPDIIYKVMISNVSLGCPI